MKITSRTEYGLRAMAYLAARGGRTPAPLGEIAAAEGIPGPFLERILARLRDVDLVKATRGASGGYALARSPDRVAVADIVTALEGPLVLVDCVGTDRACARADGCAARVLWRRLDEAIAHALEGVSLADLVAEGANR
ncbi:MAG TPA: Rrf2 family transcriptional regulator [Thermoleophilia bacterium]|nr:Rrf2 family transcriptional regulator [Thermoleophilia bacterium]HQG03383.1 Rrf2 family transcriptional regulator [Thermoleophilia bacterium]HQJ97545.1 Rrf2 family transcriptional regulator [Thermoleophilia bacterium]